MTKKAKKKKKRKNEKEKVRIRLIDILYNHMIFIYDSYNKSKKVTVKSSLIILSNLTIVHQFKSTQTMIFKRIKMIMSPGLQLELNMNGKLSCVIQSLYYRHAF